MRTDLPFATRMKQVRNSRIREILKATAGGDIISFAGGLPDSVLMPGKALASAARVVLERDESALQYSVSEGLPELRATISDRYRRRHGLKIPPEEILITHGAQQGLDLIAKVFIEPGDPVYLERPSYLGAIQSFSLFEARPRGVALDEHGTDVDDLAARVEENGPGLFYSVPNFQNPTGITCSLERRIALSRLADKAGLLIVEDDPYGELRFEGEDLPPLRALGADTIMLGSFSKIIAPGLRVGWICARPEIMRALAAAKQASDLHTGTLNQAILLEYLKTNDLDEHIATLRATYRRRRDALVDTLSERLPSLRLHIPTGGMFLWCELNPDEFAGEAPADELCDRALKNGVAFVPGGAFFPDGGGGHCLRLNFTNSSPERLRAGVERLARAVHAGRVVHA